MNRCTLRLVAGVVEATSGSGHSVSGARLVISRVCSEEEEVLNKCVLLVVYLLVLISSFINWV
jgi:hypothetical protein